MPAKLFVPPGAAAAVPAVLCGAEASARRTAAAAESDARVCILLSYGRALQDRLCAARKEHLTAERQVDGLLLMRSPADGDDAAARALAEARVEARRWKSESQRQLRDLEQAGSQWYSREAALRARLSEMEAVAAASQRLHRAAYAECAVQTLVAAEARSRLALTQRLQAEQMRTASSRAGDLAEMWTGTMLRERRLRADLCGLSAAMARTQLEHTERAAELRENLNAQKEDTLAAQQARRREAKAVDAHSSQSRQLAAEVERLKAELRREQQLREEDQQLHARRVDRLNDRLRAADVDADLSAKRFEAALQKERARVEEAAEAAAKARTRHLSEDLERLRGVADDRRAEVDALKRSLEGAEAEHAAAASAAADKVCCAEAGLADAKAAADAQQRAAEETEAALLQHRAMLQDAAAVREALEQRLAQLEDSMREAAVRAESQEARALALEEALQKGWSQQWRGATPTPSPSPSPRVPSSASSPRPLGARGLSPAASALQHPRSPLLSATPLLAAAQSRVLAAVPPPLQGVSTAAAASPAPKSPAVPALTHSQSAPTVIAAAPPLSVSPPPAAVAASPPHTAPAPTPPPAASPPPASVVAPPLVLSPPPSADPPVLPPPSASARSAASLPPAPGPPPFALPSPTDPSPTDPSPLYEPLPRPLPQPQWRAPAPPLSPAAPVSLAPTPTASLLSQRALVPQPPQPRAAAVPQPPRAVTTTTAAAAAGLHAEASPALVAALHAAESRERRSLNSPSHGRPLRPQSLPPPSHPEPRPIPQRAALADGAQILVRGLQCHTAFNGRRGVVVKAGEDGQCAVMLDGLCQPVAVRREHLLPVAP